MSGKDAFETLLEMLRGARPAAYDMVSDPLGEVVWSRLAATLAEEVPFTAGEAPPDTAGVDWANVIEEIEGVGRFARYAVLTELRAALRLVLMAYRWPAYQEAGRWLAAADGALIEARTACDPGMEGRLDLEGAYRDARGLVEPMRT